MTILVTGGAGYIGSHTCVELLNDGYDVVVVDNYYNSVPEVLNRVEKITGKTVKRYECDIRDREGLEKVFEENTIDAVIHFAGLKAVGESTKLPLLYYQNNVYGSVVLFEVMSKFDCKKIVFSSSATVYGNNPIPYKETMPTGDVSNPYGRTKHFIEQILGDLYRSDDQWSISLLRYFNPIGAHESGLIGEDPNGIPNNLMPYISRVAIGKLPQLTVFGGDYDTKDGTCIRDYIHVVDLAKAHLCAVAKILETTGIEAYNIGNGKGYSVLDIIHAFEKASGKKLNYVIGDRREGDLPAYYADAEKANTELNWHAEYDIDKICEDTWNFQTKNPDGIK
ncbi:MAG: UDP-glucose 4-epimerase GalE [Clostridia bacterium]|nr:UDP-glucose 4-epimerase GalE [Clostridia bacterium]